MDIHHLGRTDYQVVFAAMQAFAAQPAATRGEQLWLCEHAPVYTLGRSGHPEHVLDAGGTPVVASDRGGMVTYHGPGQVVAYPLVTLARHGLRVREYVYRLEEAALRTLARYGVVGHRVAGAPGVYVRLDAPFDHGLLPQRPQRRVPGSARPIPDFSGVGKIAALGIRVSNHCCYHGLALNVAMDLAPFARINPCGFAALQAVDLACLGVAADPDAVAHELADHITRLLAP